MRAGGEPGHYEMIFGRRAFFGHVTAPDGEVWWFANLPRRSEPARGELLALHRDDLAVAAAGLFDGDAGPAAELIRASDEPMPLSPIHSIPHLPRWHRDRMLVIGDAAHAPSPSSGQGASLAIEDAVVLGELPARRCPTSARRSPASSRSGARVWRRSSAGPRA